MIALSELSTELIAQYESLLITAFTELYPQYSWSYGSLLFETVIHPNAIQAASQSTENEALRNNLSLALAATQAEPDIDLVTSLASNFRVSPGSGQYATGFISVYNSQSSNLFIPVGSLFTAGGISLTVTSTYVGTSQAGNYVDTETTVYRAYTRIGADYVFTVPVRSVEPTSVSIAEGLAVTMTKRPATVRQILVSGTIGGGRAADDVDALLAEARYGITAKVPSGNAHLESLVRQLDTVSVRSMLSFGINDPECIRDRNNVFGFSTGGRVDAYVRTAAMPLSRTVSVSAVMQENGNWQAFLNAADSAGFYDITSITHDSSTQVLSTLSSIQFGYAGEDEGPSVFSADTARFSVYQTATIQFAFPGITAVTGEMKTFNVTVRCMPSLDTLQEFINLRSIRNEAQDVLFRGAIPVRVSVGLTLFRTAGDDSVTESDIQQVVTEAINQTSIGTGRIDASLIVQAIGASYPAVSVKFPVHMDGQAVMPDGTYRQVASCDGELVFPESGVAWVTDRNMFAFAIASDVHVDFEDR